MKWTPSLAFSMIGRTAVLNPSTCFHMGCRLADLSNRSMTVTFVPGCDCGEEQQTIWLSGLGQCCTQFTRHGAAAHSAANWHPVTLRVNILPSSGQDVLEILLIGLDVEQEGSCENWRGDTAAWRSLEKQGLKQELAFGLTAKTFPRVRQLLNRAAHDVIGVFVLYGRDRTGKVTFKTTFERPVKGNKQFSSD